MIGKNVILFTVLTILTLAELYGQSSDISLGYAPISAFRTISANNEIISNPTVAIIDSLDSPIFGNKVSLKLTVYAKKDYLISTGLAYKRLGKTITRQYWNASIDSYVIPRQDDFYLTKDVFQEKYHYISWSLNAGKRFYFGNKLTISPSVGFNIDYLADLKLPIADGVWKYRKMVMGSEIDITLSYQIQKRFKIYVAPLFAYHLSPSATIEYIHDDRQFGELLDFEIKQHNYYYGLDFGIIYLLKNKS